jgi:hypothetical protein
VLTGPRVSEYGLATISRVFHFAYYSCIADKLCLALFSWSSDDPAHTFSKAACS